MNILSLPKWNVLKVQQNEHDYLVTAEPEEKLAQCPHCGAAGLLRFGKRDQIYMHLPMHGKRVGVLVPRQRYRCAGCGKVTPEPLPDVDEKHRATEQLVSYVAEKSLEQPFTDLAHEVGLHERTVRRIFRDHVAYLDRTTEMLTPVALGIDEVTIKRTARLILTNLVQQTVYDLYPSRKEEHVARYLRALPHYDLIKLVSIDMWRPYKLVVQEVLPQAKIVVDKFHVVRMANKAVDDYRKSLREGLSQSDRRKLMRHRFVLLKRQHDLDEGEKWKLELWRTNFAMLGIAHELKEAFYGIYDAKDRHEAKRLYWDWLLSIPQELQPYFKELTTALKNWEDEIFAYFDYRITNAFTESMNSIVRKIQSEGRGYSFDVLRAKIRYTYGFKMSERPKFQRQGWDEKEAVVGPLFKLAPRPVVNYGVPISTFVEKYASGDF
jgi:transposase